MNAQLSRASIELPREAAQLLADFLGAATFETFASATEGKPQTYELRDAAQLMLDRLREIGFVPRRLPRVPPDPTERPLMFVRIPLRYLPSDAKAFGELSKRVIDDIRGAIESGHRFPSWPVSDFDLHLITIGPEPGAAS